MRQRQGFPQRLREARLQRGLSHRELGKLIGKARSTVCNYERGVGYPTVATTLLMADVLHVSVDDLLGYRLVQCREAKRDERARYRADKQAAKELADDHKISRAKVAQTGSC